MPKTLSGPTTDFKTVVPTESDPYWVEVREIAHQLNADGCSGVADFYLDSCLEHDIHYRTHHWIDGTPIFKSEADARFRAVIQSRSWLGLLSPMAVWRWAAVSMFGDKAWNH